MPQDNTKTVAGVPARRACGGTTKNGNPCRNPVVLESGYCLSHSPKEIVDSRGFGGVQPGSGRPLNPRPHEVMTAAIQEHVGELVDATVERALHAERTLVSQSKGIIGTEPDEAIRHRATETLLAYGLGRPTSRTEVSGPEGGPVSIAHLVRALAAADDA